MYRNWTNAVMALHEIDGYMERLINARKKGEELIGRLNSLPQIEYLPGLMALISIVWS